MTAEEYFSAEDYGWLRKVAAYDREDPGRLVFADDGEAAEAPSECACRIAGGDWRRFLDCLEDEGHEVQRHTAEPDFGRCLILCLRYCVDAQGSARAMRWLGFLHQIGRFVERDAHEAARLYRMAEARGDRQSMVNLGYLLGYGQCR